jgi:hypothetical protein
VFLKFRFWGDWGEAATLGCAPVEFDVLILLGPRKKFPGMVGIAMFEISLCLCITVLGYINQPKELVAIEVYHFQQSCEQDG